MTVELHGVTEKEIAFARIYVLASEKLGEEVEPWIRQLSLAKQSDADSAN